MKNRTDDRLTPGDIAMTILIGSCICIASCDFGGTAEKIPDTEPKVIKIENPSKVSELENLWDLKSATSIMTKIYEVDGEKYQIFWIGNGSEEAALVVINLREQAAKIKYYENH